jgi:hypothetical protein
MDVEHARTSRSPNDHRHRAAPMTHSILQDRIAAPGE